MTYRGFANQQSETVTVTPYISHQQLTVDGKSRWETSGQSGAPAALKREPGQSIQQALAPFQNYDLTFFSRAVVPQQIRKKQENAAYGASLLTHQGQEPATVRGQ